MNISQIGVMGMGVMGANLARNFASRDIRTAVYNRTYDRTTEMLAAHGNDFLTGYEKLEDFVAALEKPRRILIMVKAGPAVDEVVASLKPLLDKGDVLIDCGNSLFMDTVRRTKELAAEGFNFVGMGVSGGEEGALLGPSIMPGGSEESWISLKPLLEKIAAKDFDGGACVAHIGEDGAGHYVKMVHNGIEYAIMQLIAEIYDYSRKISGRNAEQIAEIFEKIQKGPAQSFLSEITIPVLKYEDKTATPHIGVRGIFLVDRILDKAAQKGTGGWTAIEGFKVGTPIPAISEAVMARAISSYSDLRLRLTKLYKVQIRENDAGVDWEKVMEFGMIIAYAQGLHLIKEASREYKWQVDLAEVCRIWQGGCIIRSELLKTLRNVMKEEPGIEMLLESRKIVERIDGGLAQEFRKFTISAMAAEIALPVSASMLTYFDGIKSSYSPANLIQGLRDFFGAHTFERTDKPGVFHDEWK